MCLGFRCQQYVEILLHLTGTQIYQQLVNLTFWPSVHQSYYPKLPPQGRILGGMISNDGECFGGNAFTFGDIEQRF